MANNRRDEWRPTIDSDEGWRFLEQEIKKMQNKLEEEGGAAAAAGTEHLFSTYKENHDIILLALRPLIRRICSKEPTTSFNYAEQFCEKYRETTQQHMAFTTLPRLREKKQSSSMINSSNGEESESLLREFVKIRENQKTMVSWMQRSFSFVDWYYGIHTRSSVVPKQLNEVGFRCFKDLVYAEFRGGVRDAVICLMGRDREGEEIDRGLLKTVVDIFVEMDGYEGDFEAAMLEETAAYYSRKGSRWVLEESGPGYMFKVVESLDMEKYRASYYLRFRTESKLLQRIREELLDVYYAAHVEQLVVAPRKIE